ncbi:hypothetical protein BDV18DRAFT_164606 [Aspergillus unguis]
MFDLSSRSRYRRDSSCSRYAEVSSRSRYSMSPAQLQKARARSAENAAAHNARQRANRAHSPACADFERRCRRNKQRLRTVAYKAAALTPVLDTRLYAEYSPTLPENDQDSESNTSDDGAALEEDDHDTGSDSSGTVEPDDSEASAQESVVEASGSETEAGDQDMDSDDEVDDFVVDYSFHVVHESDDAPVLDEDMAYKMAMLCEDIGIRVNPLAVCMPAVQDDEAIMIPVISLKRKRDQAVDEDETFFGRQRIRAE